MGEPTKSDVRECYSYGSGNEGHVLPVATSPFFFRQQRQVGVVLAVKVQLALLEYTNISIIGTLALQTTQSLKSMVSYASAYVLK